MRALSVQNFANSLEKLYPVRLLMNDDANRIQLDLIEIHESHRNMGIGTEIMDLLISYSQLHRKPLELTPSSDFGGKMRKLKKFYKRFGFVKNKERRRRYALVRYLGSDYYYN